jgi:TonB-dependent starch-binding outer membrane protein SusC
VTGLTARHTTTPNLTNRLTVGYDLAVQELRQIRPFGFLGEDGIMSNKRWSNTSLTLDYVGSYDWRLNPDFRVNVAWGGQTITNEETSVDGYAEDFPGPVAPTLTTGATTLAFEDRIRVITGGFFTQTMFDLRDRYFLTLGVRVDGNSAFGEDFGWQAYPKASLSYVLSDEDFWPAGWGEMKLRSAFGWAGRAPGAFDAVRTWNPVGWGGESAFRPGNVGNPDLGPERTQEIELGFDGSFLEDRLHLDFTWYQQVTSDALFFVRQVPSMGFLSSQLDNVGEIQNQGVELSARAVAYRSPDWELGFGMNVSTNRSEVRSLGGAPEFVLLHFGWIMEGEPAPVIRADRIMNPDEVADPIIEQDHVYGPNMPTLTLQPSVSVRFPRGIEVMARGEYQGGHYMYDGASLNALNRAVRWPTCNDAYPLIDAGQLDQLTARQRMWCIQENVRADWFIYPADFFRLREVSLRAPLPFQIPGATNASVTLSARNAWRWLNSDFPILDPEMTWQTMDQSVRSVWEHVPTPAIFTASVRVNF